MTIDFTCQKCEGSFELGAQDLLDGTAKLVCPHCDAKAASNIVEDFAAALAELRTQVAVISKKFAVNLSVETEDLEEELDDDEADEASEDEETDDDELDFDEDDADADEDTEDADEEDSR